MQFVQDLVILQVALSFTTCIEFRSAVGDLHADGVADKGSDQQNGLIISDQNKSCCFCE